MVLVEGNRIVAVGGRDALTVPAGAEVVDARGMTILPGLIDAHVHLDILGHSDYQHSHGRYRDGRYAEIMAISTRQLLMSGVTTVVDLAGQPGALGTSRIASRAASCRGPASWPAWGGSPTGRTAKWPGTTGGRTPSTCAPWDEARAAARTPIAQGAGIIKVHTGLTEAQLRAIPEEADVAGVRITGHMGTRDDLLMRIRTGHDGIEHLSLGAGGSPAIAPGVLRGLVEEGTYVVPTMIQTAIQGRAVEWPDWRDNPRAAPSRRPTSGAASRTRACSATSVARCGCGASTKWGRSCASSTTPACGCSSAPTAARRSTSTPTPPGRRWT